MDESPHDAGGASDTEIHWWPAWQVAREIRAGRISSREYLEVLLARISRHDPDLRLVVTIDERAHAWAKAADEALLHDPEPGPLHGVAMTVKDSLATAGLRTTAGTSCFASYVPRQDADAVSALRRAGAIVFGKTNLAEECADVQSDNPVHGTSCNPWDPGRTTGGSSGGSAGAVAAGFSPLELGSDVAGSIRIPAAACGVFGHKPSFGLVPFTGHLPPYQPVTPDIAVLGPIGRSIRDLDTVLGIVAEPDEWNRPAWRVRLPERRPVRRVAAWFDDAYCPVDHEVRSALLDAAHVLSASGITVEDASPPGVTLEMSDLVARRLLASSALTSGAAGDPAPGSQAMPPSENTLGGWFATQTYREWSQAQQMRNRLRKQWHEFFRTYDAILLPVAPNKVLAHDHRPFSERDILVNGAHRPYWDQIVWACLTGVSHLPSTVVPVRRDSQGLPIGVAIAGPYLEDLTVLSAARTLAALLPPIGHPEPPLRRTHTETPMPHEAAQRGEP